MLIGAKLLQLAATNCTHGGHKNTPRRKANQGTEWKMFHNLFKEHTAQSRRASRLWGRLDRGQIEGDPPARQEQGGKRFHLRDEIRRDNAARFRPRVQ